MKLRNKQTGEIIELLAKPSFAKRNDDFLQSEVNTFNSLAELNEEWEDYEEPKEYYYLNEYLELDHEMWTDTEFDNKLKALGNYFETKEEAEKVVEKLKAWKRLKDNCGISFSGINRNRKGRPVSVNLGFDKEGRTTFDEALQNVKDLALLFGGTE